MVELPGPELVLFFKKGEEWLWRIFRDHQGHWLGFNRPDSLHLKPWVLDLPELTQGEPCPAKPCITAKWIEPLYRATAWEELSYVIRETLQSQRPQGQSIEPKRNILIFKDPVGSALPRFGLPWEPLLLPSFLFLLFGMGMSTLCMS